MEKREIDLTVSCYGKVKGVKYDVVILPWGATEPHNLHLPYLTDCILPHDIAVDAAALALQNSGVRCMVMPPVPFGAHNPGQRELPFCIHTRYSTQQAILEDIVASLYAQGMRKLIILSGHGGNKGLGITACRSLADLFNGGFLGRLNEFLRAVLCLALCHQHHDRCTGDGCATDGCRSFLLALQQLHSCVNAVLRIFVGGIREAFKKAFLYFTFYHCCCL